MMKSTLACTSLVVLLSAGASSQTVPPQGNPPPDPQPIYRVTVVSRTLEAINYEHRSGPTIRPSACRSVVTEILAFVRTVDYDLA